MVQPRLGCLICNKIRKTEKSMFNHLKNEHADTISGHLDIINSFSCEEGSTYWKKYIPQTANVNRAVKAFNNVVAAQEKFEAATNELNGSEEQEFLKLTGATKKPEA
jgi:hypothetical protein